MYVPHYLGAFKGKKSPSSSDLQALDTPLFSKFEFVWEDILVQCIKEILKFRRKGKAFHHQRNTILVGYLMFKNGL